MCVQTMSRQSAFGTDLWGEPVPDRVHVVAGCRGAHEGVGVAGEAVAVG